MIKQTNKKYYHSINKLKEFIFSLSEGNVLVRSPYTVTEQAVNSNIQGLAEKALSEYSEIMKDLEKRSKKGLKLL